MPTALKRRPPMPLTLQAIADEVIEQRRILLRRVKTRLAQSRHIETSAVCPLLGVKRT
jgi:hypothetical protein